MAMESLHILRNHLNNNNNKTSFGLDNFERFSTILDDIEKQINNDLDDGKNELHYNKHIAQCINLEGLDGCGKSTVANELYKQFNERGQKSRLLYTPPEQLQPFRSYFDAQPESIRRAYYDLGNIIVSFELKNQQDTIIILDRYWPSTIAYKLAKINENNQINISWPDYLVQPALIIYLYVDEVERCRRISQRSTEVTLEEKQLAEQEAFRRRLDSIYRNNIPSTHLYAIDGNRSTNVIINDIMDLFEKQNKSVE